MPRCAAQLVHWQPVPALVVVLVAEEALAQLGQPVLSALQGAHELLLPVAQQDVVVGPLSDEPEGGGKVHLGPRRSLGWRRKGPSCKIRFGPDLLSSLEVERFVS